MARPAYRSAQYRAACAYLKAHPETQCAWCGAPATTVDHEPPVALGGTDADLVPACWPCNARRGSELGHALKRRRHAIAKAANVADSGGETAAGFWDAKHRTPLPSGDSLSAPPSRVW